LADPFLYRSWTILIMPTFLQRPKQDQRIIKTQIIPNRFGTRSVGTVCSSCSGPELL
jgi:hypothetical protein